MTVSPFGNLLEKADEVSLAQYLDVYKTKITQESERLFVSVRGQSKCTTNGQLKMHHL